MHVNCLSFDTKFCITKQLILEKNGVFYGLGTLSGEKNEGERFGTEAGSQTGQLVDRFN